MALSFTFQLTHQPNLKTAAIKDRYGNSPLREIAALQQQFFQLLLRDPITLSLRYLYDPHQQLQIFLLFHIPNTPEQTQISQRITSALQVHELSQIYQFQPIDLHESQFQTLQNLDWVEAIVEISKADIISDKGYYLPRPFPANPDHSMVNLCEQLHRIRQEKFLLEITLQPATPSTPWQNALDTLLNAHAKNSNSANDPTLETIIKDARDYQTRYSHTPLFTYSLKLLAADQQHLPLLTSTWLQNATTSDYTNLHPNQLITRGDPAFQPSLQATQTLTLQNSPISPRLQTWQQQFGNKNISQLFGKKSLYWGDGSTTAVRNYTPPPQPPSQRQLNSSPDPQPPSTSLATSGSQSLANLSNTQAPPAKIQDILPLKHLTTLEEISPFLRLVIPENPIPGMAQEPLNYSATNNFPQSFTIHDVINKFGHLITEDTYVAGVDIDGNPCISDFSKLAHRLVGGMNGTGKTNYILSVIYQFLHANPEREVFMIDFQAGLHYEFTINRRESVSMVTTVEDCDRLLKEMIEKHSQRREEMKAHQCRGRKELFEKTGIKQNAVLVVIDEAFQIKNADRDYRKSIETNLNTLAAQARVTGIHILYSTQTPTSEVIDSQTLNNIGERVLLAIESAGDSRRIIGTDEAYELPLTPKGRALFKGIDRVPVQIATPLVPDEVW